MTVQLTVEALLQERAEKASARRPSQRYATSSPVDGAWGQPSITHYSTLSAQDSSSRYVASSAFLLNSPDIRSLQPAMVIAKLDSIRSRGDAGKYDTSALMDRETKASQWIEGIDATGHI